MKLCVETSTTFDDWVCQSEKDYQDMLLYLKENDFAKVGELTEKNALAMHATTKTASPAFSYLTDASYEAMDFVRQLREQGESCYFYHGCRSQCQGPMSRERLGAFIRNLRSALPLDCVKNKGFEPR